MTLIASTHHRDDHTRYDVVAGDGSQWVIRTVPWHSTAGVVIGIQRSSSSAMPSI